MKSLVYPNENAGVHKPCVTSPSAVFSLSSESLISLLLQFSCLLLNKASGGMDFKQCPDNTWYWVYDLDEKVFSRCDCFPDSH